MLESCTTSEVLCTEVNALSNAISHCTTYVACSVSSPLWYPNTFHSICFHNTTLNQQAQFIVPVTWFMTLLLGISQKILLFWFQSESPGSTGLPSVGILPSTVSWQWCYSENYWLIPGFTLIYIIPRNITIWWKFLFWQLFKTSLSSSSYLIFSIETNYNVLYVAVIRFTQV